MSEANRSTATDPLASAVAELRDTRPGRDEEPAIEQRFLRALRELREEGGPPESLRDPFEDLVDTLERRSGAASTRSWVVVFLYHIADTFPERCADEVFHGFRRWLGETEEQPEVVEKWLVRCLCALVRRRLPHCQGELMELFEEVFHDHGTIDVRRRMITQLTARRIERREALVGAALRSRYRELRMAALQDLSVRDDAGRMRWTPEYRLPPPPDAGSTESITLEERLLQLLEEKAVVTPPRADPDGELRGTSESLDGLADGAWQEAMLVNRVIQDLEWSSEAAGPARATLKSRLRQLVREAGKEPAPAPPADPEASSPPGGPGLRSARLSLANQAAKSLARIVGEKEAIRMLVEDAWAAADCDERRRIAESIRFVSPTAAVKRLDAIREASPLGREDAKAREILTDLGSKPAIDAIVQEYKHRFQVEEKDRIEKVDEELESVRDRLDRVFTGSVYAIATGGAIAVVLVFFALGAAFFDWGSLQEGTRSAVVSSLIGGGLLSAVAPFVLGASSRLERAGSGMARSHMASHVFAVQMRQIHLVFAAWMDEVVQAAYDENRRPPDPSTLMKGLQHAAEAVRTTSAVMGPPGPRE